jgi:hypothetical protein
MAREATYFGRLNPGDFLFLPFYGVSSCAVNLMRVDNLNSTGDYYAGVVIPKVYDYDKMVVIHDAAQLVYGFPRISPQPGDPPFGFSASTAAVMKEAVSGRTCTLGGTPTLSNLPVQRLWGNNYMIGPGCSIGDTGAVIAALENAGSAWTVEFWVNRQVASAARIYSEFNAGPTTSFDLTVNAGGTISLQKNGASYFTTAYGLGSFTWTHIVVVSNGTQILLYVNGALQSTTAYTHATGLGATATNAINFGGSSMGYVSNLYVYNYALGASRVGQHYDEIAGLDYYSGSVLFSAGNLGQGWSGSFVFSNNALPFATATNALSLPVGSTLPLQGIGRIRIFSMVCVYEIHTEELEIS